MGRHAGLLLGVGLTVLAAQGAVVLGFWVEFQRAIRRSRR